MMLVRLLLPILFVIPLILPGQIVFDTVYYSNTATLAKGVAITPEGGYLISGISRKFGDPNGDIFAMKIDSLGKIVWEYPYGGQGQFELDDGRKVIACQDGGYAICGSSWTNSHGYNDMSLTRIDENGNELWMKTYGGAVQDEAYGLSQCRDGGFLVVGHTSSWSGLQRDVFVVRTNSIGDTLWTNVIQTQGWDIGKGVIETFDGGALVCGAYDLSPGMMWILRFDVNGDTIWTRTFGLPDNIQNRGDVILALSDSTYIVCGTSMIKINDFGDTLWTRMDEGGNAIGAIDDDFFFTQGLGIRVFDSGGNLQFNSSFIGAQDAVLAKDNGFFLAGSYDDPNVTHLQVQARKTNCYGKIEQDSTCISVPPDTATPPIVPFEILLYPNPAYDQATVEIRGLPDGHQVDFVLFDNIGRRILDRQQVQRGNNTFDLDRIASGIYYLRVSVNGTSYRTDKLLVRR